MFINMACLLLRMTREQAARIIADEIERRFSDIGQLLEKMVDYHLDVLDRKISGNQYRKFRAGGVYGIERYLRASDDKEYHLRDVRKAVVEYLTDRIEMYPSDMQENGKWYLGYGAMGSTTMIALSEISPEATAAGIAVFGIGTFVLVFRLTRRWRKGFEDLYATRRLISSGDLDGLLVTALENNRERYLEKFDAHYG